MKKDTPIAKLSPEKGFEWFFHEYWNALRYYAFKFTNDADVAEDAVQRSFIVFHETGVINAHIKKPDSDLKHICKSWLYTTTRNWCLNWLKAEMSKKVHLDNIEKIYSHLCEDAVDNIFVYKETEKLVREMIKVLPSECKKVFVHLYIQGNTVRETAQILGLQISTIKNQKFRGLDLLRKVIDEDLNVTEKLKPITIPKIGKNKQKNISHSELLKLSETMKPREIAKHLSIPARKINEWIYLAKKKIKCA